MLGLGKKVTIKVSLTGSDLNKIKRAIKAVNREFKRLPKTIDPSSDYGTSGMKSFGVGGPNSINPSNLGKYLAWLESEVNKLNVKKPIDLIDESSIFHQIGYVLSFFSTLFLSKTQQMEDHQPFDKAVHQKETVKPFFSEVRNLAILLDELVKSLLEQEIKFISQLKEAKEKIDEFESVAVASTK